MATTYAKQAARFLDKRATVRPHSKVPLLNAEEVVLFWNLEQDQSLAKDLYFLTTWVCGANYTDDDTAAASTVADWTDSAGNTYSGTWRHVRSWRAQDGPGYYQLRRKGYATTILSSGAFSDEAMVLDGSNRVAAERSILVQWRNVSVAALNDCVIEIMGVQFADPIIQGETYSGIWVVIDAKPQKHEEDGSGIITAEVAKVSVIEELTDLSALTPIKKSVRDVNRPFAEGGAYTSQEGNAHDYLLEYTYVRLSLGSRTYIETLTDTNFQSLAEAAALEAAVPWKFVKKDLSEAEDHTLTLKVYFQRVSRIQWTNQDPDHVEYDAKGTLWERRRRTWFAIDAADESLVVEALIPSGAFGYDASYKPISIDYKDNGDGSKDYIQTIMRCRDWPAAIPSADETQHDENDTVNYRQSRWFYSYDADDASTAAAAILSQSVAGYRVDGVATKNRNNGIVDLVQSIVLQEDQTSSQHAEWADTVQDAEGHTMAAAELADESFSEGTLVETQSEPRPDRKYRTHRSQVVSTASWFPSESTVLSVPLIDSTRYVRLGFNIRSGDVQSALTSFSGSYATANNVNFSISRNRDGTYDLTLTAESLPGDLTNDSHSEWADAVQDAEGHSAAAAALADETFSEGTVVETANQQRADGKYRTQRSQVASTASWFPSASTVISVVSYDTTRYMRFGYNVRSADVATAVSGFATTYNATPYFCNVSLGLSRNRDGTYDVTLTAAPDRSGGYTQDAWELSSTEYTVYAIQEARVNNYIYTRNIAFKVYVRQTGLKDTAYTHAFNTGTPLVDSRAGSSKVEALKNGQYMAFRVERYAAGDGAWSATLIAPT